MRCLKIYTLCSAAEAEFFRCGLCKCQWSLVLLDASHILKNLEKQKATGAEKKKTFVILRKNTAGNLPVPLIRTEFSSFNLIWGQLRWMRRPTAILGILCEPTHTLTLPQNQANERYYTNIAYRTKKTIMEESFSWKPKPWHLLENLKYEANQKKAAMAAHFLAQEDCRRRNKARYDHESRSGGR